MKPRSLCWSVPLANAARSLCQTAGQRSTVLTVLELWIEQQPGAKSTVVEVSAREVARRNGVTNGEKRDAARAIDDLVKHSIVVKLERRGRRGARLLSVDPILNAMNPTDVAHLGDRHGPRRARLNHARGCELRARVERGDPIFCPCCGGGA